MENIDLWRDLLGEMSIVGMRVDVEWVLGKNSQITKRVDKAAKAAAARGCLYSDRGYKAGKISRSKVKGAAKRFIADGRSEIIHVYRKGAAAKQHKIRFHVVNEEDQSFSGSYYAYASDEVTLELHRGHAYRVRFNNDPKLPLIEAILEEVKLKPHTEDGGQPPTPADA